MEPLNILLLLCEPRPAKIAAGATLAAPGRLAYRFKLGVRNAFGKSSRSRWSCAGKAVGDRSTRVGYLPTVFATHKSHLERPVRAPLLIVPLILRRRKLVFARLGYRLAGMAVAAAVVAGDPGSNLRRRLSGSPRSAAG